MYINNQPGIEEFVRITSSGVTIASFTEIRNALISRYKLAYGQDIDLSTGTADGIFINDLALIINNICMCMLNLYSNLDVNSAAGRYLDNLCAFSNVNRKQATHSTASIQVENTSSETVNYDSLTFIDRSGLEWVYDNAIEFAPNEIKTLTVTCTTAGAVEAPPQWIYSTIAAVPLHVEQPSYANVGHNVETDAQLRARRNKSLSSSGITILESIIGSLLDISGIDDVKIYNNNSGSTITTKDGSLVLPHSIYVVIRYATTTSVADSVIAELIHSKLTPGIHTSKSIGSNVAHEYTLYEEVLSQRIAQSEQTIYWSEAVPYQPVIEIQLKPYPYFTVDEFELIAHKLMDYLSSLPIGAVVDNNQFLIQILDADPKFNNNSTYAVVSVTPDITTADGYLSYNRDQWKAELTDETDGIWTLTLGESGGLIQNTGEN